MQLVMIKFEPPKCERCKWFHTITEQWSSQYGEVFCRKGVFARRKSGVPVVCKYEEVVK